MHSFTFATDLLDYKFFGCIETELSTGEVRSRWSEAPDRHEASELICKRIETRQQSLDLVAELCRDRTEWSSEALFCTIRTMVCLQKVRLDDVLKIATKIS